MPFGKLEPFDIGSHNWEAYCRRVKQFIALNSITEDLHVATLVTHVGVTCYELMCDLCSPDLPEDKPFEQLVQIVKDHLEPQRSEIAERHMFRLRKQLQGEVVSDYLKSLKHLAKHCNFRDTLEVNLRDQFVSGLLSEDMRSRLFAERNIDYKRAVELALALEAAERHAAEAASGASSKVVPEALHRIRFSTARGERGRIERHGGGQGGNQVDAAEARASTPGEGSRRGCWRCGRVGHQPARCKFKSYSCDSCGMRGHLKAVCVKVTKCSDKCSESINQNTKGQFFLNDSDDSDLGFYNIICDGNDGPYYLKLKVENLVVKFEIDTGSKISAISKYYYDKYFSNICLQHKNLTLKSYTGNVIEPLGYIMVNIKYQSCSQKLPLFVIANGGPPLLGRTWIRFLQIDITNCHNLSEKYENNNSNTIDLLRKEFPEVFADGLGTFKTRMQLHLADKTPVFVKSRPLPLALRAPVERELERLQRDDVIYKVDRSDYGTPIVPIIKKNGDIRICGDYKITINPLLKDFHYPLPQIEDIFATLGEGKQFSKLDLSHAYQQVLLTEDSQAMTAITTHVGTFVYKRVPFGIKCVPEYFEKLIEETLCGLSSTVAFQDDICVTGKDKESHCKNLRAVLTRLKTAGLRVNWSKCEFFKDSVTYLGYKINKDGLHTDVNKIDSIVLAPSPKDVTQLKSFIGLVNFYSKFCVHMSSVLKPLYNLLKKNVKWNWSPECESAFNKIKKILSSSPVLAQYDPQLPLLLSVDSSAYGLGAVLAHRYPDGSERLISCASRTLNDAERNYSQLDKEALAIIFGVSRHHRYLFGRHFTLRSDHRPLSYIFGKNKGIPQTAAGRLQRYAIRLAAYNFDIEFISSSRNCFADALSRLPLAKNFINQSIVKKDNGNSNSYLMFIEENLPITFYEIKKETAKDATLNKIISYVKFGWPEQVEMECYKQYHIRRENIFLEQGCLVWGYRVIIPANLHTAVLNELHSGHIGVVKMKQLARNYLWWSGLDADIERVCRECAACRAQRAQPPPAPLHTWEWPREPWSRLNIDFLGPFRNQYYLVILDAHSKWLEVEPVSSTSAATVIACLRKIFARFGLCKVIVSDNGPPFSSFEYLSYLNKNGIKRILVAPYHPSSNGAAENVVKAVKLVLKKAIIENENLNTALCKFLFTYRNTEHCTTQKEPSVALLGHRLRGRLDLLRPNTQDVIRDKQDCQEERRGGSLREMAAGDRVLVRNYNDNLIKWKEGVVTNRTGPVSYVVKTKDDNRTCRRHVDQMIAQGGRKSRYTLIGMDSETPGESESSNEVTTSTENSASASTPIKETANLTESGVVKEAEICTKKALSPSQIIADNNPNINPFREKLRPRIKKVMKL